MFLLLDKRGQATVLSVAPGTTTALYHNGQLIELLKPGRYAWWRDAVGNQFFPIDLREQSLEIGGQDMVTADKLAIRLNVAVSYRVENVITYLSTSSEPAKALYREAQLLVRSRVGARDLDALLADKDSLSTELEQALRARAAVYGFAVTSLGVKDIILPGEIKTILNRLVEAKKASEAATIVRREETAAMRHQLNSAKLMADNPVLMRLRELETLEKVATSTKLKVILGEKGLAEKIASLV